jgi:hypothetical protein
VLSFQTKTEKYGKLITIEITGKEEAHSEVGYGLLSIDNDEKSFIPERMPAAQPPALSMPSARRMMCVLPANSRR